MNKTSLSEIDISVLMPVYNGSKHLALALESVLNQSHSNFELIIIDDCSSDDSLGIIESYDDPRIILIKNKTNLRTATSLNKAISLSKGKYLARMDQDDICFHDRFMKQYSFLEANPEYGICGTQIRNFGEHMSIEKDSNFPVKHHELQLRNLYYVAFAHTSVMMRKSVLVNNNLRYRVGVIAEDYSLWMKMLLVTKGANLQEVLMKRRVHASSTTSTLYKRIENDMKIMRKEYVKSLLPGFNELWYIFFCGSSRTLRILAMNHFCSRQKRFESNLFEDYMKKYNNYFLKRKGWRWVLSRIKERLSYE